MFRVRDQAEIVLFEAKNRLIIQQMLDQYWRIMFRDFKGTNSVTVYEEIEGEKPQVVSQVSRSRVQYLPDSRS